ncbi:HK97 gp10 family phage protein [Bacillus nakamurai]|uniref:Phage portal protein n=1 Tax=Bacillus nakamurai TaxID=1793963 RepID=A0A150F2W3_9BACI|nr:HK97 gp10 family phage protein [Bacillus nakamurai]KXZ13389.1 phage portal protein [Bacillus nakamurai]MCC9024136.1 HK97 gp10 family phage protein [Bacillus nakamurai]MED1227079.1 HK97 gp10 family phage protein [Bacillus nakamurai]
MKIKGLEQWNQSLAKAASGDFSRQAAKWLEQSGMQFLDLVRDELIHSRGIDTERLLSSFRKGAQDHVWITEKGGLSLEIGTNLDYASFLNDGHWTVSDENVRWVPGYFQGSRFIYDPSASTGMALKKQWISGSQFWDDALLLYEKLFENSLNRRLDKWLNTLGGKIG